jgi:hypothetical protein
LDTRSPIEKQRDILTKAQLSRRTKNKSSLLQPQSPVSNSFKRERMIKSPDLISSDSEGNNQVTKKKTRYE